MPKLIRHIGYLGIYCQSARGMGNTRGKLFFFIVGKYIYSVCVYICIYVYIYAHMYMYTHTYIYMYVYMYVYVYIYTHTYMYMYTHTYIHVCICVYMYRCVCLCNKICHFNHFPVYNSVALSTFTMLCNHHHYPFPEIFHQPKQKLCTH